MSGDVGNQRQNGAPDFRFLSQIIDPIFYSGSEHRTNYFAQKTAGAWSVAAPAWANAAWVVIVGGGAGAYERPSGGTPDWAYGGGGGGAVAFYMNDIAGRTLSGVVGAGGSLGGTGDATTCMHLWPGAGASDYAIAWGGGTNPSGVYTTPNSGAWGGLGQIHVNSDRARYHGIVCPGHNGQMGGIAFTYTSVSGVNCVTGAGQNTDFPALGGLPGMTPLFRPSTGNYMVNGRGGDWVSGAEAGYPGCVVVRWCY